MPAQLVALSEGPNILLDKPILLLGRDPECDIQLDSRKVSRRHCCIAQVGDYLVVRDLASTNGIRINGVRVLEGYLKEGDELTIGHHRYQICWDVSSGYPGAREPKDKPSREVPSHDMTARAVEDDALESCEEPIPLRDLEDGLPLPPSVKFSPSLPPSGENSPAHRPSSSPPLPPKYHEPLLPDQLELAPASDILPPGSLRPPTAPPNG